MRPIRNKEREIIIQSLRSGVVPKMGLHHIQVGRSEEIKSFVRDIQNVSEGGSSFRFVIGEYGSGKTFFLSLIRSIALEKGLVTMHADLSPFKRLHGSQGQARHLLSELISSLSTRTRQDGNALENILERFISVVKEEVSLTQKSFSYVVATLLKDMSDIPGGYNFIKVINAYCEAYEEEDDFLKSKALKWLRAEYTTKKDSYVDLGVREFISDKSLLNTIKLYCLLVRKAGYNGLMVCMDELVNLYKITNTVSRNANYEEILRMLNDTLQGSFSSLGFIMGGTPEFLTDHRRGLYSYEALRSRLTENTFASQLGLMDYNTTVLRLASLTKEELYVLLQNLRHVFAYGDTKKYLVPDPALNAFLVHCSKKIGDSYFRTPRTTIKSFLDMLSLLEQYPQYKWSDILESVNIEKDREESGINTDIGHSQIGKDTDDEFASFKL
jgi:hypothetical protein